MPATVPDSRGRPPAMLRGSRRTAKLSLVWSASEPTVAPPPAPEPREPLFWAAAAKSLSVAQVAAISGVSAARISQW